MTNFENEYDIIDDKLGVNTALENDFINDRLAVRYIRTDVKAVFYKPNLFTRLGFNFFRRLFSVKLIDISSTGALISTDKKFKVGTKIVLGLKFKPGKIFKTNAVIVRKSGEVKTPKSNDRTVSTLKFNFVRMFSIHVLVKSKPIKTSYEYGIKFHNFNHELGNYLLETQNHLKFK